MAEESTTTPGAPAAPAPTTTPGAPAAPAPTAPVAPDDAAVLAAADNPDAVKAALDAEREQRRQAEARARDAEAARQAAIDATKTAEERAEDTANRIKAAEATEAENLRLRVGLEQGLPADAIDRLQGSTREELVEDAAKLKALLGTAAAPQPAPDLGGGTRTPADAPASMDDRIRSQLGRGQPQ